MQVVKSLAFWLWLLALAVGGWIILQLPLASIATHIRALSGLQWLAWIALNLLIVLIATQRWWLFANMLQPVSFGLLLRVRQAGQAISFITPGPQFGGEPLQILWLYKQGKIALHKALLALGLDRFYELWTNAFVLLISLVLVLQSSSATSLSLAAIPSLLATLVLPLIIIALLFWVIWHQSPWLGARLERVTQRWAQHPRLRQIDGQLQAMKGDLRQVVSSEKKSLLIAAFLSLAGWVGLLAELALLLNFVGIEFGFSEFMLILVALRLALLLPLPGGVGTLEAAVIWSFHSLDLPASAALGFIALMRLRDIIVLVIGLACVRWLQVGEKSLSPSVTAP